MTPPPDPTRSHYDDFLARNYIWMAGGLVENSAKCARFFAHHGIRPMGSGTAVDLGAGCGFATLALAALGFSVTAVDFSRPMLSHLTQYAAGLPVQAVNADIRDAVSWAGHSPELIACTGDTLTHLADREEVQDLIRNCCRELSPGGTLILSCRDYSQEPAGSTVVLPVRRDPDRIFLCRLEYDTTHVRVTDILFSRESGIWQRYSSSYTKTRIARTDLITLVSREGLVPEADENRGDRITIICQKPG